jgi:disulfide bond formation protein DsbB
MATEKESAPQKQPWLLLAWLAVAVAVGAALLAMLAGVGSRFGWWHFRTGFSLLGYAAYGGIAAALLGFAAAVLSGRKRHRSGVILAVAALIGGLTIAAVPASWRLQARQLPMIHDISTDTLKPPEFVAILPLRRDAPNPATYGGPAVAAAQHRAYADLRTEVLNLPLDRAFDRALATARGAGWRIVAAEPATGRIEATATTFWFGFSDDIVIRLVGAGERTMVDVRSVSRVGKSDVGTNAKRIRAYLQQLRS